MSTTLAPLHYVGISFNSVSIEQQYNSALVEQDHCLAEIARLNNEAARSIDILQRNNLDAQKDVQIQELSRIQARIEALARQGAGGTPTGQPIIYQPGLKYILPGAVDVQPTMVLPREAIAPRVQVPSVQVPSVQAMPMQMPSVPMQAQMVQTAPVQTMPIIQSGPAPVLQSAMMPVAQQQLPAIIENVSIVDHPILGYRAQTSDNRECLIKWCTIYSVNDLVFARKLEEFLIRLQAEHSDVDFHELVKEFYARYSFLKT